MYAECWNAGWSGTDLKEFVEAHKTKRYGELNRFAGGELSKLEGTPLFPIMLEATAIRYALEQVKPGHGIPSGDSMDWGAA